MRQTCSFQMLHKAVFAFYRQVIADVETPQAMLDENLLTALFFEPGSLFCFVPQCGSKTLLEQLAFCNVTAAPMGKVSRLSKGCGAFVGCGVRFQEPLGPSPSPRHTGIFKACRPSDPIHLIMDLTPRASLGKLPSS